MESDKRNVTGIKSNVPFVTDNPNQQSFISPELKQLTESNPEWHLENRVIPSDLQVHGLLSSSYSALEKLTHPYHNKEHTQRVVSRVTEFAKLANLNEEEKKLLIIAAAFHDYDHAGHTFRKFVPKSIRNDISNEEYAVISVDKEIADILSPIQRLEVQGIILATSFAQGDFSKLPPEHAEELYRQYRPTTKLEKLIALADVSNFLDGIEVFMSDNIHLIGETGKAGISTDFDNFIETRIGFLGYVKSKLIDASEYFDSVTNEKYTRALEELVSELKLLKLPNAAKHQFWKDNFDSARTERLSALAAG